jgi:hypothetical protein
MSHRRMAERTTQRPEGSSRDGRNAATRVPFRALCSAAALALSLSLIPFSTLFAAEPSPPASPPPDTPKITLGAAEVPATGAQSTLLTVDRFGRYSVRVESSQGSSVEVIDRMAGSLGRTGEAGRENGRLDLFLDRGQYKIAVRSAAKGSGKAKVLARSFREQRGDGGLATVPRLVETRVLEESLDDLEQVSYWLEIGERRGVRLEAAGRNLADLRLWREGSWLEGTQPHCEAIQPVVGQPLLRCRLAAILEPGLYLLTAYGGVAQPWSEGSDAHPFYLRWGEPQLPETGRRRYVVSPFGEDHYRLPDNVNFFRAELPEARPLHLDAGWVRGGSLYEQEIDASSGDVTKESLPPAVEIRAESKPGDEREEPAVASSEESAVTADDSGAAEESDETVADDSATDESGEEMTAAEDGDEGSGEEPAVDEESAGEEEESADDSSSETTEEPEAVEPAEAPATGPLPWELVVTVSGAPGQPYVLQHFEQRDAYAFHDTGPRWISSVHAGAAEDSIDATALIVDVLPDGARRFLTAAAIPLDSNTSWSRRFNLLEGATLFLEVKATGRYKVVTSGTDTRARVEPFFMAGSKPEHYESPVFQGANSAWDLDAGFYVLTLEPQMKGIVTVTLGPAVRMGLGLPAEPQPVQAAARFAPLQLEAGHGYEAYLNHQPGVTAGWVLRPWPVDLASPLPVSQKPGDPLRIPFSLAEAGTLRAETEAGVKIPLSVDGGPWQAEVPVAAGDHSVEIRHDLLGTIAYSLWVEPESLQASTPLPPLPDAALNALPKLPVLATGAPQFLDLERGQKSTYLVRADKAGLYAVVSTGLLATTGTLRTRTVPALRREQQNGVGRNFMIQQYLREGDYQVTVEALGQSQGHLGLTLETTTLLDGGELRAGMPAHFTLPAGQAAAFKVVITEAGAYNLRALGLGFKFLCRFEDADGWPRIKPNIAADLDQTLDPGTYRFVLLPQPVDARALVLLERKPEALTFSGHGPHALPLEKKVENVWLEPEGPEGLIEDAVRPPDVWRFELPAKANATIELTEEMQGHLFKAGDAGTEIAFVPPGRSWRGELEPGVYELSAEASRRNSRVRYQVAVHTDELVTGLERTIRAPGSVSVSVGKDGLVELSSIAPADVRASLSDADGELIAESDDRPDDWNFLIFQRLAPGIYTLNVDPVGAASGDVRVAMRTPAEVELAALGLPFQGNLQLGSDVLLRPLTVDPKADLLLVAARSKDSLGLSVEAQGSNGWRTVGTAVDRDAHLEVPLEAGSNRAYRMRVWSLDRHETPLRLSAAALKSPRLSERELRRGAALPAVAGFDPALGAAMVELDRPGVFRLADPVPGLRGSGLPGSPLTAVSSKEGGVFSSPAERFWLVRPGKPGADLKTIKAERIVIGPGLDAGAQFPVPDGSSVVADLSETDADGPVLALVTAPAGQPGVRLGEADDHQRTAAEPAAYQMAVGPRTSVAVALEPRHPVARVWQAGARDIGSGETAELRLAQLRFPKPATEKAAWGVLDGKLEGSAARQFELPEGSRKIRLSLGEGTVAVLSHAGTVISTHWQGGAPFEERLDDNAADRLTLLHLRPGSDPFTVELLPRADGEEPLAFPAGAPFERSLDRAGTLRLTLPATSSQGTNGTSTVHVRGAGSAETETVLLGRDGTVSRGADLPVGKGGVLLVRHGPGLLLAWLGAPGEETASLWPASGAGQSPVPVHPPMSVPLTGRFADLAVAGTAPRVLHLRAPEPIATLLRRAGDPVDGKADEVEVHRDSGKLDVFLPAGEARLGLRALAGAQLSGVAEITETPVTAITEGLGPEVLLPAGGSRWFSFHVDRPGPIGVGAHADSDIVEIELYDRSGHRLDEEPKTGKGGVIRMPELPPGDYLLALRSPAGAAPVKARPAVAGLVLPDTGPPADVIQQYLQDAGAETAPESVPGSEP